MGYNFEKIVFKDEELEDMFQMYEGESDKYNSHYSFSEIAEKYNVSYTTISKALQSKNYRRYADMINAQRKKRRDSNGPYEKDVFDAVKRFISKFDNAKKGRAKIIKILDSFTESINETGDIKITGIPMEP